MKILQKLLTAVIIVSLMFTSLGTSVSYAEGKQDTPKTEKHATGLKAPTDNETKEFKAKAKTVKKILPNAKGLERINNARTEKGLDPLPKTYSVSASNEIISKQNSKTAERKYKSILSAYGDIADSLPTSVDNSAENHFPAIGDQGYIGSCSSFATTYYAATYETARIRDLDLKADTDKALSPRFTYNLENDGEDAGSSLYGNFLVMYTHGAPFTDEASMTGYQYNGYDFISGTTVNPIQYLAYPSTAAIWRDALKNRLTDFGTIEDTDTSGGLTNIKSMLNNEHVLVFGTSYMYDWDQRTVSDDPGTADDDTYAGQVAYCGMNISDPDDYSGHALTIVGYDDSIWTDIDRDSQVDSFEKGAFKVANSWGADWGNQGFLWLAYDALHTAHGHTGVIDDDEMIYLVAQDEYTPLATSEVTITTARRNQLWLYAGANWNEAAEPYEEVEDYVFSGHWGGNYSFDGTTTASTATVVLDLTDYLQAYELDETGGVLSFCTGVGDDTSDSYSQTVSSIVYKSGSSSFNPLDSIPSTVNNTLKWFCGKAAINSGAAPAYNDTVSELPVMPLNSSQSAHSTGPDDVAEWRFTPAVSGKYTFSNSMSDENGLEIQNCARSSLYFAKSSLYSDIHGMTVPLYAGKTYVLRVWYDDTGTGENFTTKIQLDTQWADSAYSAKLDSISLSTGETLTPAFNTDTFSYSANIAGDTVLTATPEDTNAYILNGDILSTSRNIALENDSVMVAHIEVTAKDWLKTNVYNVTLTRGNPSSNADLSGIGVSSGSLSPAFSSEVTAYSLTLPYNMGNVTITPTKSDSHATVYINSRKQNSLTLAVSSGDTRDAIIKVMAPDLKTSKTYTVHISRPLRNNANLSGITSSAGLFYPQFNASTLSYGVLLNSDNTSTIIGAASEDVQATVRIDGEVTAQKEITLQTGQTKVCSIAVTSLDGSVTKTYNVTIYRQKAGAPITINADLIHPSAIEPSPDETKIYMTDNNKPFVYEIDLKAGTVHALALPYKPYSLCYSEGRLFVTLTKPESGADAAGIIDPRTFSLTSTMNVDMDFSCIAADATHIYPYSFSSNKIMVYDRATLTKQSEYFVPSRLYDLKVNPVSGMLYVGQLSSISSFRVTNGQLQLVKQNTAYGFGQNSGYLSISPDGRYVIRYDGSVLTCSTDPDQDLIFTKKIPPAYKYSFDNADRDIYVMHDRLIEQWDMNTLTPKCVIQDPVRFSYCYFSDNYLMTGQYNAHYDITFKYFDPKTLLGNLKISGDHIGNLYPIQDTIDCGEVPLSTSSVDISALPLAAGSQITGDTGAQTLNVGSNTFSVTVNDPSTGRTKNYNLNITRKDSDPAPITLDARVKLPFMPYDIVSDPQKPIFYMTSYSDFSLYRADCDTGDITVKKFMLRPQNLTVSNGKIYVTMERNYGFGDPSYGSIAVVDAETFKTEHIFDVAIRPRDIVADTSGRLYISSNDTGSTILAIYDSNDGRHIRDVYGSNYWSTLAYNTALNKLYSVSTTVRPMDMYAYEIQDGDITKIYDSPYQGEYGLTLNMFISPDGQYIYNGSGNVFSCAPAQAGDMVFSGTIGSAFAYLCFDMTGGRFYTSNLKVFSAYDYSSRTFLNSANFTDEFCDLQHYDDKVTAVQKKSNGDYYVKSFIPGTLLANIAVNGVTITGFDPTVKEYNLTIPTNEDTVNITAPAFDPNSQVTGDIGTVAIAGTNVYTITVTPQKGQICTYTMHVTKAVPGNAYLSAINTSAGTLTPAFNKDTLSYWLALNEETSSVIITPAKSDSQAAFLIDGSPIPYKMIYPANGGSLDVTILVTAKDGITKKTYTVHVTRAISTNANLASLYVSSGSMTPTFSANTTEYYVVLSTTSTTTIYASPISSVATMKFDGAVATSKTVTLNQGQSQDVVIEVTAQDGITKQTYTVHVLRPGPNNAYLSSLSTTAGTLSPAFNANTCSYTVSLSDTTTGTTITAAKADSNATLRIDGAVATSKTVTLNQGQSQDVVIEVTAQDGITKKTYTVHVTRLPGNAYLSAITVSTGTLTPTFDRLTVYYTLALNESADVVGITTVKEDNNATTKINGIPSTSTSLGLPNGRSTDVVIEVTASDGVTKKTYTVHVSRAASSNANLSGINLTSGSLTPVFNSDTLTYSTTLTKSTSSTTLTPVKADSNATVKIDGATATSKTVPLGTGESRDAVILVTAQDGTTTKTYTVHVTREASSNANLSGITGTNGTLSPAFAANTTNYSMTLPNTITSTTIAVTKADSTASVRIDGAVTSSKTLSLAPGESKDVIILVTAQDGTTTKTYTVHVARAAKRVSGVSLNLDTLTLVNGGKGTLTASVTPADATNRNVSWSSSNTRIATVAGGAVTAAGPGKAVITVTTQDGGYHDTCTVTVTPRQYTVAAGANSASFGTVSGSGVYDEGVQAKLRATPKDGYRFVRWIKDGTEASTKIEYVFTVAGNVSFTAEFAAIGIPASISAAAEDYDSITVKWGPVSFAAGYEVWRSTAYNGTYKKILTTSQTVSTDSGLVPRTTYFYMVNAYCVSGSTTTHGIQSTIAYATPALQIPSVSASAKGYDSIHISWSRVPGASGYQVYRSTSKDGRYSYVTATGSTSYTNTRLNTGTTYYYKVCAYRYAGSVKALGNLSESASATPLLGTVTNPKAQMASVTGIKVTWNSVAGRSGYEIWRSTSPNTGYSLIKSTSSTYLNNTSLTPNINYYYKIRAYRTVNRVRVYGNFSGTVNATPVFNSVTGTVATKYNATSIKIKWNAVAGRKGYEIWRSTSADGGYSLIKSTTTTSLTDMNLATNTAYYYKVRAYCLVNGTRCYSNYSNTSSATPVLAKVTSVTVSIYRPAKLRVTWSSVYGRTGYEVWRSTSEDSNFVMAVSTISTAYYDADVKTGITYSFKIRAYRLVNNVRVYSDFSTQVSMNY